MKKRTNEQIHKQKQQCEADLICQIWEDLRKIENNKSSTNDRLTKEFYKVFGLKQKAPVLKSFRTAFFSKNRVLH